MKLKSFPRSKKNLFLFNPYPHKVLTYVECRAVPGVFQNIDPPPPSPPSVCVLPPHQRREGTHSPGGEGDGGVNILEDASHRIGLLQSNLSTPILIYRAGGSLTGAAAQRTFYTCKPYRSCLLSRP